MGQPARWRVSVNPERCQGHNRCYAIAPELFDIDEYGNASAKADGAVPTGMEDKARLAAQNCPELAVSLTKMEKLP
jgi:ferredoxin